MNSKTILRLCLVITGVVIVALLMIYSEDIKKLGATEISIEIVESSTHSEENITFIETYKTSIPFAESGIHNRIFVVHDNKRNVTCYLYKDGISCIPDYYIGDKNV